MEHHGPPINWRAVFWASEDGRLMDLLVKLPRARWVERSPDGDTLLHYACYGPNEAAVVALLHSRLVDVNARNSSGWTPAYLTVVRGQPCVLRALCAAGADLRARNLGGHSPIDMALLRATTGVAVRELVANGVRLSTAREGYRKHITPELVAFERGVLRCRAAVVAMLRVKRASGQLVRWDKFLLAEMAVCIWSTRYLEEWQTAMQHQEAVHAMLPVQ